MVQSPNLAPDSGRAPVGGGPPYRTSPDPNETGWPKGIKYIIGNEGCERFSFYGMRAILWMYIAMLYEETGITRKLAEDSATTDYHIFNGAVYALPVIGAIISDRLLGKYKTILWLSIVYTVGHGVLSFTEGTFWGMYLGLGLIAVGSGGIKPCVSAHVGDQFGKGNWHMLEKVYQGFYFIINFGSFFSTILTPWLRSEFGWSVAFAVPGVLMGIATIFFWLGRNVFIHVPPAPGGKLGWLDTIAGSLLFLALLGPAFYGGALIKAYGLWSIFATSAAALVGFAVVFLYRQSLEEDDGFISVMVHATRSFFNGEAYAAEQAGHGEGVPAFFADAARKFGKEAAEGPVAVLKIVSVFALVSVFWALFDQHSSTWIRQATMMDRDFGWFVVEPDQFPALNPLMVMILIAFNNFLLFPGLRRIGIEPTPLRRMTAGMGIAAFSFVAVALVQRDIDASGEGVVHIAWQILPYLLITLAEVLVSITGLEFAYSQAPRKMKSTIMGFWLLTVTFGNFIVAALSAFGDLALEDFFWVFAGLMAAASLIFALRAAFYKTRDFAH